MYALDTASVATPIGLIVIEGNGERISRIHLAPPGPVTAGNSGIVREAAAQIEAYFAGRLRTFDLPLLASTTPRGAVLRQAMIDIGYGETASYGALAAKASSSARALGQACARNPFPIVVPCHRVVQAGGVLGPYSAGEGSKTKRWLLQHEGVRIG